VSNFIKNLAKRGAGLPLAAEARPAPPAPAFASSFAESEGLSEITSEEATARAVDSAPARTFETPQTFVTPAATPDMQPSPLEQVNTAARATPQVALHDTTVFRPSASIEEIVSSTERIPSRESNSETAAPRAEKSVSRSFEVVSRDSEVTVHAEGKHKRAAHLARPSSPADLNPPATVSPRLDQPESSWSETSPLDLDEPAPTTPEPAAADLLIRPAATENRPVLTEHLIRPAATDPTITLQFPSATAAPQSPAPIHVRIGRVEVRGNPPVQQPPIQAPSNESPPLGFAGYQRLRRYRN
jgi:hypothetical protein